MQEFSCSQCTFSLLARGLDNLLFAPLPLLSLSSDHLLVSGRRLDIHLVTDAQEQETLFDVFKSFWKFNACKSLLGKHLK